MLALILLLVVCAVLALILLLVVCAVLALIAHLSHFCPAEREKVKQFLFSRKFTCLGVSSMSSLCTKLFVI